MTRPKAELSAFDIGCVVTGGIIGVGIFFTPQAVAAAVDSPGMVILAWGLGGLLAVLGAVVFAELARLVPGHGGTFRYLERAFGARIAFLYGWTNWLVIQAGAAGIVSLILVDHLEQALAPASAWTGGAKVLGSAALLLLFTGLNALGLRSGKGVQNALTVLKVLALGLLVSLAWIGPETARSEPLPSPSGRPWLAMMAAAMLPVLFATGGWQQGSFVAGAARRPRSVAIGILGGVAVVVIAYLTVNLAYLELLGFEGARTSRAIGAVAAKAAMGESGGRLVAAMIVVSAAGILNTICLAPPYVLHAMAREGCFPRAFASLHPRTGVPLLGVLTQGLWAIALLLLVHGLSRLRATSDPGGAIDTLDFVCTGVVFADWLFFALSGLALLVLRHRAPRRGGVVAPVAVLFALGAVAVTVGAVWTRPVPSLVGVGILVLGLLVDRFRSRL